MPMNIVQVYAPTATSTDSEIEAFYDDVKTAINKCKSRDITMVIGDWNAKVSNKESCSAVGPFGLDERNEVTDLLNGARITRWSSATHCSKIGKVDCIHGGALVIVQETKSIIYV